MEIEEAVPAVAGPVERRVMRATDRPRKKMSMLEAVEWGRRNNETRLTWEEVMGLGLYTGMLYGEIGGALRFSYRMQREGNDQYLMTFARALENRVREIVGADRTALLREIDALRAELVTHNAEITGSPTASPG